ncbi:hypothetical protein [Chryseobacterium sp. Leaf201]|uniref:hypothetical protein n=1 Tax=Chryseobacterium sp. Leaf201 TaxID=1735672 RepID=UPI0006FD1C2B|nr:hypothetical protein [Chryseobacterium sp. Leaf201]KQM55244.1 hypothetical protein ASE55_07300 [Chryseobacterium sp. Leaf201]
MKKNLSAAATLLFSAAVYSQVGINTQTPRATLDVTAKINDGSRAEGIIPPRLTGDALHIAELNNVYGDAQNGALVFVTAAATAANQIGQTLNLTSTGLYYFNSTGNRWMRFGAEGIPFAAISGLNCSSPSNNGTLSPGTLASGVSTSIPYNGGNGGTYSSQSIPSTGVTGLTATLSAGGVANGNGMVTYTISGTPSVAGNAKFAVTLGGQNCTFTRTVAIPAAAVTALNCNSAGYIGTLISGSSATGISSTIPYSGGNGGTYASQSIASTGVTGLTATLSGGNIANGNGSLNYVITGTPLSAGTAVFNINLGSQSCSFTRTVTAPATVSVLDCGNAAQNKNFDINQDANALGVTLSLPYIGGNSSAYPTQTISSTGVSGFTATLAQGTVNNGSGTLTFNISGTSTQRGVARFVVSIGGQSCTLNMNVGCGAYIAPGQWKAFMCHNLGADTSADPYTPAAAIHGAKYQWGATTGLTGRYVSQAQDQSNSGNISGWSNNILPSGTWSNSVKTTSDPCPSGYRVPTAVQWTAITDNNTVVKIGSWSDDSSNYGTAIKYGDLLLPAAGLRYGSSGSLWRRGERGVYWSSTYENGNPVALSFTDQTGTDAVYNYGSGYAVPIRCISQ